MDLALEKKIQDVKSINNLENITSTLYRILCNWPCIIGFEIYL